MSDKNRGFYGKYWINRTDKQDLAELQAKLDQWNKHDAAEEPSELYFNEVYGIGSMRDHYKIVELQKQVEELQEKLDACTGDYRCCNYLEQKP